MLIDNSELKKEIAFYVDSLDTVHKNEDYVIRVYCKDINDSIQRYCLTDEIDYDLWNKCPYHFRAKVHNKDILFVMSAGYPSLAIYNPYFKMNDEDYSKIVQKYFPKIYRKYGLTTFRYPQITYEPDLIFLTFLRGRLISKYRSRGMPEDKIAIHLNDTTICM